MLSTFQRLLGVGIDTYVVILCLSLFYLTRFYFMNNTLSEGL